MNNQPIRIALVGLGGHGQFIQNALAQVETLQVAAVYDPNDTEAQAAAARFDCPAAPSYEALLADDTLDAVALITPNFTHRTMAEAAFAAGLHVFVEKPIANTLEDGQAILEAAERAGKWLMVGQNMRFGKGPRLARQFIEAGKIGEVVSIELHFSANNTPHLPKTSWRLNPDLCPLMPVMQLAVHGFDLVHYMVEPIRAVQAMARAVTTPPEVVDSVNAIFQTESGILGTMISNYCTQVIFEFRVAGTKGSIWGTPHRFWMRASEDTNSQGEGPTEDYDYRDYDPETFALEFVDFAQAIQEDRPPEIDGAAGMRALAVVEAMLESTRTGQRVSIPAFTTPVNPSVAL